MTTAKLASLLQKYYQHIVATGAVPDRDDDRPLSLPHLAFMCTIAQSDLVPAGRWDKAHRWLGWVQAGLVNLGHFTLADVRNHARSEKDFDP